MISKISFTVNFYLCCLTIIVSLFGNSAFCQTSIRTGVTFQWSDVQLNRNQPATLASVTIDGQIFDAMAVPTSYHLTRLGPDGHNRNEIVHGPIVINDDSSNIDWNADALMAFQDRDLTHYFSSNRNGENICSEYDEIETTESQIQTLRYNPGIPSNEGGVLAVTERNANNCYYISLYGIPVGGGPETFLGDTFILPNNGNQNGPQFNAPPADVDYWNSGRVVANNGTIGIALFVLDDLAPIGSVITRLDITAASKDHGDGKMLILQDYATVKTEEGCRNNTFNGTLKDSNTPVGSTFTMLTPPSPSGESFTLSSDGSYSYTPSPGFIGDVTWSYEVCLPAPNQTTCDRERVTITFQTGTSEACFCASGNANAPALQN